METVADLVVETLFELIVEGTVEVSLGKAKVPMWSRIFAAVIFLTITLGFSGFIIIAGIRDKEMGLLVLGVILFILYGIMLIYKWWEYRRKG